MKKKPFIAGNWKLHKTVPEAVRLAGELEKKLGDFQGGDLLICPPFIDLAPVAEVVERGPIALGGQDLFWEEEGAYTGAVSGTMLKSAGCRYVIVGHSERRQLFGDSNEMVNRKLQAALRSGLTPILCLGEPLEKREQKVTKEYLRKQLAGSLKGLSGEEISKMIIAYEPIWAIGTGRTATPALAQETHFFLRQLLEDIFSPSLARSLRILYGGSVKPENARALIGRKDIDGFLIGGASLKADSFAEIAQLSIL
jgi:triosephosphate isomerase